MISLQGFNNKVVTFESYNNLENGLVSFDSSGEVKNAGENEDFFGVFVSKRDEFIGVQIEGYVELPYTGITPDYGYKNIIASAKKGVVVKDSPVAGKKRLIVKVDTVNKIVGFIL